MKDYCKRADFMRQWLEEGQPKSFWLSGFFFPQVILRHAFTGSMHVLLACRAS